MGELDQETPANAGAIAERCLGLVAFGVEGRVGFEPTTPGLKVRDPSAELAAQRDQGPRAAIRDGVAVDQANPDDLPGKQGLARGRPLTTYVRCNV